MRKFTSVCFGVTAWLAGLYAFIHPKSEYGWVEADGGPPIADPESELVVAAVAVFAIIMALSAGALVIGNVKEISRTWVCTLGFAVLLAVLALWK